MGLTCQVAEGTSLQVDAAVGAEALPFVGDGADLLRLDPVALEGVRVSPAAAEAEVELPAGVYGDGRVEQGVVHGAEVELAEAMVGVHAPDGVARIGLGRTHLPTSLDRLYETEDLALSFRPTWSRSPLPLHANGGEGEVAWPGRARLEAGAAWVASTADRPHLWARAELTPLGPLPERQDGASDGPRLRLGGSVAWRESPVLGTELVGAADASLAFGAAALDLALVVDTGDDGTSRDDEWVELRSRLVRLPHGTDLYAAARVERATHASDGEDERRVGLARLSWRSPGAWGALFAEAQASRELGPGPAATGDVVALGRAERSNDWVGFGAWLRS